MYFLSIIMILASTLSSHGLLFFEPDIECTVIRVRSTAPILGFKRFPELYQGINNVRRRPILHIGGKAFADLKPTTIEKTESFEKISILHKSGNLELELHGKPISRNGTLSENGKVLADVTCH